MNGDTQERIPCPKCGQLMYKTSRCCTHCGTINPDYVHNNNLLKNIQKSIDEYQTGKTPLIKEKSSQAQIANNTGNRIFAFYVTYLLYILFIVVTAISSYMTGITSFDILIISTYPLTIITVSVIFLYIYSIELVFMKCNKPWWAGLVPIYNLMVLGEIAFHKKYIGLLSLIPGLGLIFLLVMLYQIGEKFKFNGLLTALFSIIVIPYLGFSDRLYEGKVYVSSNDNKSLEKDYRNKKIFFSTLILLILCGVVLFLMGNMGKVRKSGKIIKGGYYVIASKQVLRKVKTAVEAGNIDCGDISYNSSAGNYYISYNDLGNSVYLPLYMMRNPISAYVRVDNDKNPREYYVSMSDGEFGFAETIESEIVPEDVREYTQIDSLAGKTICTIKE